MEEGDYILQNSLDSSRPFGDIVVLWGGALRHIPSVVEKCSR